MRISTAIPLLATAATSVHAYPGMGSIMEEIKTRDEMLLGRSTELIGDLTTGTLTATGQIIKNILTGTTVAIADKSIYKAPGALGSAACTKDPLCVWKYISDEMYAAFADSLGCTDLARGAIRLGFHDAGAWDKSSSYGGADGSILLVPSELARNENFGLENIGATTVGWYNKYKQYGAGMADIIQLGANVATLACPDGPRIRSFVGRKDDATAAPDGKLPDVRADAQSLIDLFAAKTFTANDLVALVGAHTASKQRFVDIEKSGMPQDTTPHYWDTTYYSQTLQAAKGNTVYGTFAFQSDINLATHVKTKVQWNLFAGKLGKTTWGPAYANSYFRMSMLGCKNMNQMVEISKVLPLTRS